MRFRRLCVAAVALTPLLAGCGVSLSPASEAPLGKRLTIYSSLPLHGASASAAGEVLAGERLALKDAGGHVRRLRIRLVSLDDSNPQTGSWEPGATTANARLAAQDPTTIAYIGDYDSPATAVSLPIINGAGILQVSPASPYVGLTSSRDAGQDEPERFYPTARRTFGRLAPGDPRQARAQVALMRSLGARSVYVLADQDPFDGPLGQLVADDARAAGIDVRGMDAIGVPPAETSFAGEVTKLAEARPAAVFFSGAPSAGAAGLFRQLHAALPRAHLLASSSLSSPAFLEGLEGAAAVTLLGTPLLPPDDYAAAARRVLGQYAIAARRVLDRHGDDRPAPQPTASLLYGYEAMSAVLAAIRAAGAHGDDRRTVVERFLSMRGRRSVLGVYSMSPDGESSLSAYGIERVRHGAAIFWRAFSGRAPSAMPPPAANGETRSPARAPSRAGHARPS